MAGEWVDMCTTAWREERGRGSAAGTLAAMLGLTDLSFALGTASPVGFGDVESFCSGEEPEDSTEGEAETVDGEDKPTYQVDRSGRRRAGCRGPVRDRSGSYGSVPYGSARSAAPNMVAIRTLGWGLGHAWRTLFRRVMVDERSVRRLREQLQQNAALASAGGRSRPVVLLPTHKSHVDYLLLSYVCFGYELPLPHIAAGDNLNLPVVGPFLRRAGAFFIRRSMGADGDAEARQQEANKLACYLGDLLEDGRTIELFAEGGRSRHGAVMPLRRGALSMIAAASDERASIDDVLVVPVSLDYESVPEAASYVRHQLGSAKTPESLAAVIRAVARSFLPASDAEASGDVFVRFGDAVPLSTIAGRLPNGGSGASQQDSSSDSGDAGPGTVGEASTAREALSMAICEQLSRALCSTTTVTCTALVASALLFADRSHLCIQGHAGTSLAALASRVAQLAVALRRRGAHLAFACPRTPAESIKLVRRGLATLGPRLVKFGRSMGSVTGVTDAVWSSADYMLELLPDEDATSTWVLACCDMLDCVVAPRWNDVAAIVEMRYYAASLTPIFADELLCNLTQGPFAHPDSRDTAALLVRMETPFTPTGASASEGHRLLPAHASWSMVAPFVEATWVVCSTTIRLHAEDNTNVTPHDLVVMSRTEAQQLVESRVLVHAECVTTHNIKTALHVMQHLAGGTRVSKRTVSGLFSDEGMEAVRRTEDAARRCLEHRATLAGTSLPMRVLPKLRLSASQ